MGSGLRPSVGVLYPPTAPVIEHIVDETVTLPVAATAIEQRDFSAGFALVVVNLNQAAKQEVTGEIEKCVLLASPTTTATKQLRPVPRRRPRCPLRSHCKLSLSARPCQF